MGSGWVHIFGGNGFIHGYDMWIHLQLYESHNLESFMRNLTFSNDI